MKILAGLPRTQRGKPIVLKTDPKGKNILYCNGNSVFIRDAKVRNQVYFKFYVKKSRVILKLSIVALKLFKVN